GRGTDQLYGGTGKDLFVFTDADVGKADIIRDFDSGNDVIDLTGFDGLDSGDIKFAGKSLLVDTNGDAEYDLTIVIQGEKAQLSDIAFADSQINLNNYVPDQDYFLLG
ncbi:MAG TPA: hypothetical protein VD768_06450, partial [Sphingomicrobium sp.]|nr:hypothetical protein [Sphingomicrobium sp.]